MQPSTANLVSICEVSLTERLKERQDYKASMQHYPWALENLGSNFLPMSHKGHVATAGFVPTMDLDKTSMEVS